MNDPAHNAVRPAAFLDRDGTIIVEREYLADPDGVAILPRAASAIRLLNEWGFWVFGVSNQSGVARGYFTEDSVNAVNERVIELLAEEGAYINRIYYCPHHPDTPGGGPCDCRKPAPGLIHQAMHDYPVDLSRSFVVGDRICDVALAKGVGIRGGMVLTGYGRFEQSLLSEDVNADVVADDLLAVVEALGPSGEADRA
jgi:histidinol-phosphate phosphatase family protein